MTLSSLRLMVERGQRQEAKLQRIAHDLEPHELLIAERFAGRQFYCGSVIERNPRKKCFTHLCGLMEKNGRLHGWYDYELNLIKDIEQNKVKYQAIKKSRGIGISTLYLRYMAYLALCRNSEWRGKRMAIVVGPRENLAVNLIDRIKTLVARFGVVKETERVICNMLGVTIEAFPSSRVSTMRSFDDIKFVFVDEASYFFSSQQDNEVRACIEGYIAKTDPTIVMVSTPSTPGTMFENIMEESESTCLYKRYYLPYSVALNKIYTQQEIDAAKSSPNFEREYNLQYSYGLGNLVLENNLKQCIIDYQQPYVSELANSVVCVGVDQGFSTSKLGIVVSAVLPSARPIGVGAGASASSGADTGDNQRTGEKVYILEASEYSKLSFAVAVELVANTLRKYGFSAWTRNVICLIDGSRPEFISAVKAEVNEQPEYHSLIEYADKYRIGLDQLMAIIPIQFSRDGKQMLTHLQSMISDHNLAIAQRFNDLLLQLRMSKTKVTGMLDKSGASLDLVDACMLSVWNTQTRL